MVPSGFLTSGPTAPTSCSEAKRLSIALAVPAATLTSALQTAITCASLDAIPRLAAVA
jgi:hypothetical protein